MVEDVEVAAADVEVAAAVVAAANPLFKSRYLSEAPGSPGVGSL
jgi:hypothetical protein